MRARAISTIRTRLGRVTREAWLATVATLVFLAVGVWWLTQDTRVPDFDTGLHMLDALTVHGQLASGQLLAPFTDFNNYPPLVHIVGALGISIGGLHTASVVLADNIVFLPMLVGGCYGVGRIAYGPRGGLLAALFALGTPMIVSEFHGEFLIDPGEAALVAISAWAILASRRFERVGYSALAALLCSLGMLSKQTFVLFIGGLILVVLARGGWRNWRGLGTFLLVGALLAAPWYLNHLQQLSALTTSSTAGGTAGAGAATATQGITPSLYTAKNFSWYLWDMLNHQLLAPLTLLVLIGGATALWRFARRRDPQDLAPELLGGALVSYLGITYITLKDPRYTLPALVYFAVLGTGWIATARPRARAWLSAAVTAVVAVNFVMVSFGVGSTVSIALPGARPIADNIVEARDVTFFSPNGWLSGGPVRDGNLLALLQGLRRIGARSAVFDGGSTDVGDFTNAGLSWLALVAGLNVPPIQNLPAMGPHDAFILRRAIQPSDPPPCQRLADGSGVYVELGNPLRFPFEETTWVCPGRSPLFYRRTAPLPEALTHNITGRPREQLLAVMRAMHRQGISTVEFDAVSSYSAFTDAIGLQRLAAIAGLSVPATYELQTLGPRDAFMLRHVQVPGDPVPCTTLPDGSGVYIVFGNPVIPFNSYTFYCPVRSPRFYHRAGG
jgi:dolichyl-phosphate-mannose-protein mannosyltransferase